MSARRDAIAKVVEPFVEQAMGDYGSGSYDEDGMLDAIIALPIEQARDEVVEAARAWVERFTGMDSLTAQDSARLVTAVTELDELEGQS